MPTTIASERGRAVKLAIDKDKLVLSVNNPEGGSATEEIAVEYGSSPLEIGFNARYLLDIAGLAQMVKNTVARFEQLDVLINNASSFFPTEVGEVTLADWDDLVGTNLKAPLFLAQAAAPHLKKRQGSIINISDIHAQRPLRHYLVYSVAKAGLDGLTRALARELGPEVRVNGVSPGPILWPEDDSFDELARQRVISHTLLKRSGEPQDLAGAVHYLVAGAPYVTGQILAVDGGRSVSI